MIPKTGILETAQSTTLIGSNSEIVAQLLRDLARNEHNALRDYYAGDRDEQQICARYGILPGAFQKLKSTMRAQFTARRSSQARKTAKSAGSTGKATLRRIA